jgi:hypothetical protein
MELAKLPPAERAEWEQLWAHVAPRFEIIKSKSLEDVPVPPDDPPAREVAPPPRPVKP